MRWWRNWRRGAQAVACASDVGDAACAQGAVALVLQCFGGLDIAFNKAMSPSDVGMRPMLLSITFLVLGIGKTSFIGNNATLS
jgi:NAD(P)-dependent dehydrogenase (short-subunit alcohol dehydrogenase family)